MYLVRSVLFARFVSSLPVLGVSAVGISGPVFPVATVIAVDGLHALDFGIRLLFTTVEGQEQYR